MTKTTSRDVYVDAAFEDDGRHAVRIRLPDEEGQEEMVLSTKAARQMALAVLDLLVVKTPVHHPFSYGD